MNKTMQFEPTSDDADAIAVTRAEQTAKPGAAREFRERKQAEKAKKSS